MAPTEITVYPCLPSTYKPILRVKKRVIMLEEIGSQSSYTWAATLCLGNFSGTGLEVL